MRRTKFEIWTTVTIGSFKSLAEAEAAVAKLPIGRTWDSSLAINLRQNEIELDLALVRGWHLDMPERHTRTQLCESTPKSDLEVCPAEVALALITQNKVPEGAFEINIGSTELIGGRSDLYMSVNCRLSTPWLNAYADPTNGFGYDETDWVFVIPRKVGRH